jgi:DNA polymerase-3 subunit epsilon
MHLSETKRGCDHIEATKIIWYGLWPQLVNLGINNLEELQNWIQNSKPAKKTKYEYPLAKDKRLNLPEKPGLYRMLGKNGEVLYVGKATSLRDRVNSYFRGQKKRNSFKLQMLTQVWDINVTVCDTPLEAALLECDEIKKWSPKYNVALKEGKRELTFYSRDFSSTCSQPDTVHILGPFSNRRILSPLLTLAAALKSNIESPGIPGDLLFEPIEVSVLNDGFRLFCELNSVNPEEFRSIRSMLSWGMKQYREYLKTEDIVEVDEEELIDEELETEVDEYTPEIVADKFFRLFRHAAASLHRSKKLKKLLNCEIEIKDNAGVSVKTLYMSEGRLSEVPFKAGSVVWSVATYDRLTVLFSESKRLKAEIRLKL